MNQIKKSKLEILIIKYFNEINNNNNNNIIKNIFLIIFKVIYNQQKLKLFRQ